MADFSPVVAGHGSVVFDSLVVVGSLVGNQKLEFSGEAGKNTILYQSQSVTITLNEQVLVELIACGRHCVFRPNRSTTDAVDIALNHADLDGRIISGEILPGTADAR
jgi:hypothetical protein